MELVFVADDDAETVKAMLFFVELHAKGSEMRFAAVPVGVEFLLEDLSCLDIEGAPLRVEMLEDLEWRGVAVGDSLCFYLLSLSVVAPI